MTRTRIGALAPPWCRFRKCGPLRIVQMRLALGVLRSAKLSLSKLGGWLSNLGPSRDLCPWCQAGFPAPWTCVTYHSRCRDLLLRPAAPGWLRSGSLSLAVLAPAPEPAPFSLSLGFIGTSAPATFKEWTIHLETVTSHPWATGELPT